MMPRLPAVVLNTPAFQPLLDLLDSSYMTAAEVAERFRYTDDHLSNLRRAGRGPRFLRLPDNGRVLYPVSGVVEFELRGVTRLDLDTVLLSVAACEAISKEQRSAVIDHLRATVRPSGQAG